MGRKGYYRHALHVPVELSPDSVGIARKAIEDAVQATTLDGRDEPDVIGEIYTRTRSNIYFTVYCDDDIKESLDFMRCQLRTLDRSKHAKTINTLISEAVREKMDSDEIVGLEVALSAVNSCIKIAEDVNEDSLEVLSKLDTIDKELKGE